MDTNPDSAPKQLNEDKTKEGAAVSTGAFMQKEPAGESPRFGAVATAPRGGAGTYLPEYLVMIILLGAVVGAITSLLTIGIDSLIPDTARNEMYSYNAGLSSLEFVWSLSVLLSSLPFFVWLFLRTRKVERQTPEVKAHKWRKIFLGAFIAVESLAVVSSLGAMVFDLVRRAVGAETSFMFFSFEQNGPWWQVVVTTLVTVVVLGFTVYMVSRDYPTKEA